jgi:aspartyl-tRNA(Asn)/glutamyl-tRNA(Gln) amidotransferase subunit A
LNEERRVNGLTKLTATELADKISKKEVTSAEVVKAYFAAISAKKKINAFISVYEKEALEQVLAVNTDRPLKAAGMTGVPIAIKDNMNIRDRRTTCGSKILENFVSPYDATVIEKLRTAGAVFLGKTNMDEFAMGSSTENSHFGPTLNPWDETRIPGGSSGGSAAAVASGQAPWALGSDTGGSIRQPASLCGVVGMKPTYGLVSRYGLVAFASSLDQIGPLTRDVKDCALLLNTIAGHDPRDSTSVTDPVPDYLENIDSGVKGIRVGLPKEYFTEGIEPEVRAAVTAAAKKMESAGAEVREVSLPNTEYSVEVYYIIAPAEASSNLARYDGVKYGYRSASADQMKKSLIDMYTRTRFEGFGPEVKRRILIGTYSLSSGYYDAYYLKAQKVRTLIRRDFDNVFQKVDILLAPVCPTTAFRIGEKMNDPLQMYLSDIFTIPANMAGIPGISVPAGFSKAGLPIGVQFMAGHFNEKLLLRAARGYEIERGNLSAGT